MNDDYLNGSTQSPPFSPLRIVVNLKTSRDQNLPYSIQSGWASRAKRQPDGSTVARYAKTTHEYFCPKMLHRVTIYQLRESDRNHWCSLQPPGISHQTLRVIQLRRKPNIGTFGRNEFVSRKREGMEKDESKRKGRENWSMLTRFEIRNLHTFMAVLIGFWSIRIFWS